MLFAGIIPKKDYITINVVGKKNVEREDLEEFLNHPAIREKLPDDWMWSSQTCHCSPKIATTSAKKPFHHRIVIIGDASCSRYYKNGIESAFKTAQLAAETAFSRGISRSALKKGYFQRAKKIISRDNFFGKILFRFYDLVYSRPFLSQVLQKVMIEEERYNKTKYMRDVLWNMYTGNIPYSAILLKFSYPVLQWKLFVATLELGFASVRSKLFLKGR